MIICLWGGVGSGKSITVVKEMVDNESDIVFSNFRLKQPRDKPKIFHHRLKYTDIIKYGEKKKDHRVNWDFWDDVRKKYKSYSIYLDEVHNIIHARRSMSSENILFSKFLSQIRKILQDHPTNHIYFISQTLRKIDVDFRELAQMFIQCESYTVKKTTTLLSGKKKVDKKVYVVNSFYSPAQVLGQHGEIDIRVRSAYKRKFLANPYFKYYDTLDFVTFSDAEEFV